MPQCALQCVTVWLVIGLSVEGVRAQQAAGQKSATTRPAVLCPVTGQAVDRAQVSRFRGKWVYFATEAARQKFEHDPYEFADRVQAQWEADPPLRVQIKCPVTGEPPAADIYVGAGDSAVFFATEDAKQKWLTDSKPFARRLEAECYTFQTTCGACRGEINLAAKRDFGGRTVYFCCPGCAGEFAKDEAAGLKRVEEQMHANKSAYVLRQIEQALARPAGTQPTSQPAPAPKP